MCTGVEIALIAASAVGTGYSMYATDTAANQQESNLNYQAAQTEADAKAAQGAAQVEAMRIRKAGVAQRAKATAAAAASGVDVSSPTAVRLDEEITKNSEEDALLTILNGADSSARMRNQAQFDRTGASMAQTEGRAQQGATLLSGITSTYAATNGWKKAS